MRDRILAQLDDHDATMARLRDMADDIALFASKVLECYRKGGKAIFMGNGGSAADAQHIAAEFVGRFAMERNPLPSLALHTNTSSLTAIGNDYGYEESFSRPLRAFAGPDDVVVAISTSGNSPNILKAVEVAREIGAYVVGLGGKDGGKLKDMCDLCLIVPSDDTPRIQEGHITIAHIMCGLVEEELFG
jgi:D-sedoheptulose 7-phosphate isomerase